MKKMMTKSTECEEAVDYNESDSEGDSDGDSS